LTVDDSKLDGVQPCLSRLYSPLRFFDGINIMGRLLQLWADLIFYWQIYGWMIEVKHDMEREESAHNLPLFMSSFQYLWADQEFYGHMEYP
jgi:hypothetical protein